MGSCFPLMYNKGPRDYFYKFILSASMLRLQVGSRAVIHWLGAAAKARIMVLQCLSQQTALPPTLCCKTCTTAAGSSSFWAGTWLLPAFGKVLQEMVLKAAGALEVSVSPDTEGFVEIIVIFLPMQHFRNINFLIVTNLL